MGLIREVQGVSASLNKQERARRERERLKILTENYKKEINGDLYAEFMNLYKHTNTETAYKIAIMQKDSIIEKIYNIIAKITYTENGKNYYLYYNFDIINDLNDSYYKILSKVKNEIQLRENIKNKELFEKLENKIENALILTQNKYCGALTLQKNNIIENLIDEISSEKENKKLLKNNYNKILNQVLKRFKGDILNDKKIIKNKKQLATQKAKNKQRQKIESQIVYNMILRDISKALPKPFSRKKGR